MGVAVLETADCLVDSEKVVWSPVRFLGDLDSYGPVVAAKMESWGHVAQSGHAEDSGFQVAVDIACVAGDEVVAAVDALA